MFWLYLLQSLSSSLEITFGSCSGQLGAENEQIWKTIKSRNPDTFIWLGDAIYADIMVLPFYFVVPDEELWREKYRKAKDMKGYKELRQSTKILGVWDDHDYGANNENRHFLFKNLSKTLFLEFLDEDKDSERYRREGIYEKYDFHSGKVRVRVILLDDRTFLDKFGPDGDTLGEEQWGWLESCLSDEIDLFIIMNGIQVNIEDRISVTEKWHDKSRIRLMQLLKNHPNTIIVSGDVHHTELMEETCTGYSIIEFTSSGLTHSVETVYGFIAKHLVDFWYPFTFNLSPRFYSYNFGSIHITEEGKVQLRSLDESGNEYFYHEILINQMKTKVQRSFYCDQSVTLRRVYHWTSVITIIWLPWISFVVAGINFMRKYSNSY